MVTHAVSDCKGKFTLEQATKAQRGVEVQLYSFFNLAARWGWVVNATPRPLYPRYPLYRRLGGPQGRSGRVRKISRLTRTVQPITNRYTD